MTQLMNSFRPNVNGKQESWLLEGVTITQMQVKDLAVRWTRPETIFILVLQKIFQ